MFILLFIIFIAGIVQGRRSAKTPKRGTREGVRAIHGMRRKEHVVRKDAGAKNEQRRTSYSRNATLGACSELDYAGMYFIGVPSE
jgi:hypothetical protein